MSLRNKLEHRTPTLSYEVFPPKNPVEWGALYTTLGEVSKQSPDFISVTYRGGVSTKERTVDLVVRIQRDLAIEAVAHLTCIRHTANELDEILDLLLAKGVNNIIALRGDRPKKQSIGGMSHASDLISLASRHGGFAVACACYPEKHPEASSLGEDVLHLKLKQDCGAAYAISQFFFDNSSFYSFREAADHAGVTLPLIAGIMPVSNLSQLKRFRELSGTDIPAKLTGYLGEGTDEEIRRRGIDYSVEQCADLLNNGVAGIHLYTLNKSASSVCVTEGLRNLGYFPIPVPALI